MLLVCYNEEQNALRIFHTVYEMWIDMLDVPGKTSLAFLIDYGWEVIGEL